jgi:tetratricopeptide (TPR) repeat protein
VGIDGWTQLAELHGVSRQQAASTAMGLLTAAVYVNAGWHDVAAAECEAILREYPQCIIARRLLPVLWERAGRRDKAIAVCRKLLADGGPSVGLREVLGDLLVLEGESGEALKTYGAAAEGEGASPDAVLKHALTAYAAGDADVAVNSYESLVDSDVQDVVAKHNLAWLLAAKGDDLNRARSFAELAFEVHRDNPAIVDTVGWVRYHLGDYPAAIDLLDRAVELAPYKALYHFHLGMAHWRAGRTKEAVRSLEKAVRLDPDAAFVGQAQQTLAACGS